MLPGRSDRAMTIAMQVQKPARDKVSSFFNRLGPSLMGA
jgi:hypothetical protein